jgi:hypothetical protein
MRIRSSWPKIDWFSVYDAEHTKCASRFNHQEKRSLFDADQRFPSFVTPRALSIFTSLQNALIYFALLGSLPNPPGKMTSIYLDRFDCGSCRYAVTAPAEPFRGGAVSTGSRLRDCRGLAVVQEKGEPQGALPRGAFTWIQTPFSHSRSLCAHLVTSPPPFRSRMIYFDRFDLVGFGLIRSLFRVAARTLP